MTCITKLSHDGAPITLSCSIDAAAGSAATTYIISSACMSEFYCQCIQSFCRRLMSLLADATSFVRVGVHCEPLQLSAAAPVQHS